MSTYINSLYETKDALLAYIKRNMQKSFILRGKTAARIKEMNIKIETNVFDEWRDDHMRDLMILIENDPYIQEMYTHIKTFKTTLRRHITKFFKMRVVKRKDFYDSMRRFVIYHLVKTNKFDNASPSYIQAKMKSEYNYKVSVGFIQKIVKELESTHSIPTKTPLNRTPKSVHRMKEVGMLILSELLEIKSRSNTHTAKKILEDLPQYTYWKPTTQMIQMFLDGDKYHLSSYYKYMKYKNLKNCLAYAYAKSEEKI